MVKTDFENLKPFSRYRVHGRTDRQTDDVPIHLTHISLRWLVIIGQKRTTSVNEITPTNFKNKFLAPLFIWRSPQAGFMIYDNNNGDFYMLKNFYLGLSNLGFNTSVNYEFVPELGIQISNLSIEFDVSYLRMSIEEMVLHYEGTTKDYGPWKYDYAENLFGDWKYHEERYLDSLQFRINCVLVRKEKICKSLIISVEL